MPPGETTHRANNRPGKHLPTPGEYAIHLLQHSTIIRDDRHRNALHQLSRPRPAQSPDLPHSPARNAGAVARIGTHSPPRWRPPGAPSGGGVGAIEVGSRLSLHVLPRDDRPQLLFTHFGRTHISLVEERPGERRPGEISSLQIRANQSRLGEIRLGEISSLQIRITEISPGEVHSLQIRPAEISANEIGFSQPGLREKSMRQVCSEGWIETSSDLNSGSVTPCFSHHHAAIAEISASKIGPTQSDPSQVSSCEVRLGQIGTSNKHMQHLSTIRTHLAFSLPPCYTFTSACLLASTPDSPCASLSHHISLYIAQLQRISYNNQHTGTSDTTDTFTSSGAGSTNYG
jgi:hypothetical protein